VTPKVGPSIWDGGNGSYRERKIGLAPERYYEQRLQRRLSEYTEMLGTVELSQEADYQNKDVETWSSLEFVEVPGALKLLLENHALALHLRHGNVDIAEHENPTHRHWSLAEVKGGLEFAFRLGADVCLLHPGTFNERSGRFWPRASELVEVLHCRRNALEQSLAEFVGVFVQMAADQESRLRSFEHDEKGIYSELSGLLRELDATTGPEERVRYLAQAIALVRRHKLTPEKIRHCKKPWSGLHVCLENLEPPNFLVCTPEQLEELYGRFVEFYLEAASHRGMDPEAVSRYRPKLSIDPGHLLNTKVILSQEVNRPYLEGLAGGDSLQKPFVSLPGEFPGASGPCVGEEPLLNKVVRTHHEDISWVHLYGSQRTDTCMTTHGPIKPFRRKAMIGPGLSGERTVLYGTGNFRPEEELNLEEVVQILGTSVPYIAEVFDAPIERVKGSVTSTRHYLEFLDEQNKLASALVRRRIGQASEENPGDTKRLECLRYLAKAMTCARCYIRPHKSGHGSWAVGYDEIGFYRFEDEAEVGYVDIFATVKQADGTVWLKDIDK